MSNNLIPLITDSMILSTKSARMSRDIALRTIASADYTAIVASHMAENCAVLGAMGDSLIKVSPTAADEIHTISRAYAARCAIQLLTS